MLALCLDVSDQHPSGILRWSENKGPLTWKQRLRLYVCHIPYSRKFGGELNVVVCFCNHQIKIRIHTESRTYMYSDPIPNCQIYIHQYFEMVILGPTVKFNSRQIFWLYGTRQTFICCQESVRTYARTIKFDLTFRSSQHTITHIAYTPTHKNTMLFHRHTDLAQDTKCIGQWT